MDGPVADLPRPKTDRGCRHRTIRGEHDGQRDRPARRILDPDLPKDIVIQSWRGQKSLAEGREVTIAEMLE